MITLPNLITIARLLAVPLIVLLIVEGREAAAFWVFVAAGISDAIDGFIARYYGAASKLGAYLDPLADKLLLVSIYVTLAFTGEIALWLAFLIVSRDVLIVGGVILSWMMERPVEMAPLMISKANTTAQIVLAALILGSHAFAIPLDNILVAGQWLVAGLTVASMAAYLVHWLHHMAPLAGTRKD